VKTSANRPPSTRTRLPDRHSSVFMCHGGTTSDGQTRTTHHYPGTGPVPSLGRRGSQPVTPLAIQPQRQPSTQFDADQYWISTHYLTCENTTDVGLAPAQQRSGTALGDTAVCAQGSQPARSRPLQGLPLSGPASLVRLQGPGPSRSTDRESARPPAVYLPGLQPTCLRRLTTSRGLRTSSR
jgi:hypothetical protein